MTCSICGLPSVIRQGHQQLCEMHYRFGQMRANAKRKGKLVPSRLELAVIVEQTRMRCPGCGVPMNWRAADGRRTVVTLQHNRDGSMTFLCRGCNTRHAGFAGDSFYYKPDGQHLCRCCGKWLPLLSFYRDSSRPLGVKSYCKQCSYEKYKQWASAHRQHINDRQRARRLR